MSAASEERLHLLSAKSDRAAVPELAYAATANASGGGGFFERRSRRKQLEKASDDFRRIFTSATCLV